MREAIQRRDFLKTSLSAAVLAGNRFSPLVPQGSNTLRAAGAARNVLVGSAVSNSQLHDAALTTFLVEQCDIVAPESEMNWEDIHPERERFDFADGDELMAFAARNSLLVRGGTLCSHEDQPSWLGIATRENAAHLLVDHIRTVAGRYAGRIHSWDVVSDAIEPDDRRSDGMRESSWLQLLGLQYIAIAFRTAAKADPKALLIYSDYGLEGDAPENDQRRVVALALLRWMRANQIPIHALGLQSHLTAKFGPWPDWRGLHEFLKQVGKLELQVFVTELDIDDTDYPASGQKRQKAVAELCRRYLENALTHPQVKAVLTSGLISHDSEGHRALPLDEEQRLTPFFTAMLDTLQKR